MYQLKLPVENYINTRLFYCRVQQITYNLTCDCTVLSIIFFLSALFRNWANEPNNLGGLQHCGLIYNNGRFGDESCDTLAYYVCKTQTTGKVIKRQTLCNIKGRSKARSTHPFQLSSIDCMYFEILPKASAQKDANLYLRAHWKRTNELARQCYRPI